MFIQKTVTIIINELHFCNSDMNENMFIYGGAARDAALQWMQGVEEISVKPQDIDLLVKDLDSNENWVQEGLALMYPIQDLQDVNISPFKYFESLGEEILGMDKFDCNINHVLISKDGIFIGRAFEEFTYSRKVMPIGTCPKRVMRAHYLGLRYGFEVAGPRLPKRHSYYRNMFWKAKEAGFYKEWKALLLNPISGVGLLDLAASIKQANHQDELRLEARFDVTEVEVVEGDL